MKLLESVMYKWIAGSKSEFTKQFEDNEALYKQAKNFWKDLDNFTIVSVLALFLVVMAVAWYYYGPYNNQPGRHYKISHWIGFYIGAIVVTFIVTLGLQYFCVHPSVTGALRLEAMVALGNALYAILLFFLTSLVCCKCMSTNAYKIF